MAREITQDNFEILRMVSMPNITMNHAITYTNLIRHLYRQFYGQDWLQSCSYKTRVLWGLFAEVREKSVLGFEVIVILCKNVVLNICRYLKRF